MTRQTNESLIAEARAYAMEGHLPPRAIILMLTRVIDRLEVVAKDSAEGQHQHAYWQQRAEEAESEQADIADSYETAIRAVEARAGEERVHLANQEAKRLFELADERDAAREEVGYEKRMREFIAGERDRFIDRMKAAEQRAEQAEKERDSAMASYEDYLRIRHERDTLAAVVEKVREQEEEHSEDIPASNIERILAAAPDDVLREHDAALIEGLADEYADSGREQTHGVTSVLMFLHMKAQQRRKEKS